jgi:LmbE family N-acetylglucosaminyl deacetylase
MENPYRALVDAHARLRADGAALPLGGLPDCPRPPSRPDAPRVLVFAPHPDDEVIVGGLPLRLLRELGMRVADVAVTQGSNKARQAGRWEELSNACRFVGFDAIRTAPGGLEKISLKGRDADKANWAAAVDCIAGLLRRERPRILFFPHDLDWNATHIGTHWLVTDALRTLGPDFEALTVETEFWGAMDDPNLMVESSAADVADLVAALSCHAGEVKRNPYHLTLTSWMADNVRRGGELVGGQGAAAPDFTFATLYRLRRWAKGDFQSVLDRGRSIGRTEPLTLFQEALS